MGAALGAAPARLGAADWPTGVAGAAAGTLADAGAAGEADAGAVGAAGVGTPLEGPDPVGALEPGAARPKLAPPPKRLASTGATRAEQLSANTSPSTAAGRVDDEIERPFLLDFKLDLEVHLEPDARAALKPDLKPDAKTKPGAKADLNVPINRRLKSIAELLLLRPHPTRQVRITLGRRNR